MQVRRSSDRLGRRLRWRLHPDAKWAAAAWTTIAIALTLVQFFAHRWGGREARPRVSVVDLEWLFDGWVGRDSSDYLMIAEHGYVVERLLVVFPGFSLVLKGIAILGEPRAWGVVAAAGLGLLSVLGVQSWCTNAGLDHREQRAAVAAYLLFPYAWYLYGPLYGDSLYVAASVWAFVAVQHRRWTTAGLLGAIASATRPTGFAVAIGLCIATLEASGFHVGFESQATGRRRTLDLRAVLSVNLAWAGLAAYMGWLWVARGSPFAWLTAQRHFHSTGPATLLKEQFVAAFWSGAKTSYLTSTTLSAAILASSFVLVPVVRRHFGGGPAALVFFSSLMPAISVATFMGVGRYQLVLFPAFAVVGRSLAHKPALGRLVAAASFTTLVYFTVGFARGAYLA